MSEDKAHLSPSQIPCTGGTLSLGRGQLHTAWIAWSTGQQKHDYCGDGPKIKKNLPHSGRHMNAVQDPQKVHLQNPVLGAPTCCSL